MMMVENETKPATIRIHTFNFLTFADDETYGDCKDEDGNCGNCYYFCGV